MNIFTPPHAERPQGTSPDELVVLHQGVRYAASRNVGTALGEDPFTAHPEDLSTSAERQQQPYFNREFEGIAANLGAAAANTQEGAPTSKLTNQQEVDDEFKQMTTGLNYDISVQHPLGDSEAKGTQGLTREQVDREFAQMTSGLNLEPESQQRLNVREAENSTPTAPGDALTLARQAVQNAWEEPNA